jgi:hypothetical protein
MGSTLTGRSDARVAQELLRIELWAHPAESLIWQRGRWPAIRRPRRIIPALVP